MSRYSLALHREAEDRDRLQRLADRRVGLPPAHYRGRAEWNGSILLIERPSLRLLGQWEMQPVWWWL